jgi:uncharacterized protein YlaI
MANLHALPPARNILTAAGLPMTLRAITPAIAEAERQRLLRTGHSCWYCSKPAPVESWLFACRMRGRPVGMLVCPECLPRVRGWKPGIQIRLFAPMGAKS